MTINIVNVPFVLYVYDKDGDGFPVGWDFDDVYGDEDISDDIDGDGLESNLGIWIAMIPIQI